MITNNGTKQKSIDCVQLELFQLDNFRTLDRQYKSKKGSGILLKETQQSEIEEEWFGLTIDAPFSDCLLEEIKVWETRRTGTALPKRVFIHTSLVKLKGKNLDLASRYLGENYRPKYGHIIGTGILDSIVTMTKEFIEEQDPSEIKLGIWEIGRKAWKFRQLEKIQPIPAIGCQGTPWSIDKSKLNPNLKQQIQRIWRPK